MDQVILDRFGLKKTGGNSFAVNYQGVRFSIRPLSSTQDYQRCIRLQKITWGLPPQEVVPENVLVALNDCHLPALGAFNEKGTMLSVLIGFGGIDAETGKPLMHSHMLAVAKKHRGSGIGTAMKISQYAMCSQLGIRFVEWTVDPLRPNWALNLGILGGVTNLYRRALYQFTGRGIYHGFPADRVLIRWDLESQWVRERLRGESVRTDSVTAKELPLIASEDDLDSISGNQPARVRIEIPLNVDRLKPKAKRAERLRTRPIFEILFAAGYTAVDFIHDPSEKRNYVTFERDFVLN